MKTPVALIIFDRPSQTRQVFEAIRKAQPEILLVVADGPRGISDQEKCAATRAIIDSVDWKCDVRKSYSETNLGCRKRLSTGLEWVFEEVDRAIIFEADCLPQQSFFSFCEELLERYADDPRIMHISGDSFRDRKEDADSYYFSNLPFIWGWATWRRAWKHYDSDLKKWPDVRATQSLRQVLTNPAVYEYWETVWNGYYDKTVISWDGQWVFACMLNNGLSINPKVNLVSNIGFGPDALQGNDPNSIFANIPTEELQFPLVHPQKIQVDKKADAFAWKYNFNINTKLSQRTIGPIRRKFPSLYGYIRNLFPKK